MKSQSDRLCCSPPQLGVVDLRGFEKNPKHAPGSDFSIRQNINAMRGFQNEWRHAGESCVMQLFYGEQLHDAAVQSCATLLSLNFDFDYVSHLDALFVALECDAMLNPACLDPVNS
ncbi:hypothetical protein JCGZ_18223 [Jatropha curcas]|uniref:Uncharacterized protein n=1 Tax=Jatropha curcas TaxID=180498 RepID=A0A067LE85_JATCU|nr:hypothetical protein JCGZ_18223 [Jatropha curcas]